MHTNSKLKSHKSKLRFDLLGPVRLQDVAFLEVVEVVEGDAALVALGYLAHVVLEALERGDRAVVDDRAPPQQAHVRVAGDPALRHHEARGLLVPGEPED